MKTCKTCGKLLPKHKIRYCSGDCQPIYKRKHAVCVTCGTLLPKGKKKYCCKDCKPRSFCIDCGVEVTLGFKRCRSCGNKRETKFQPDRGERRTHCDICGKIFSEDTHWNIKYCEDCKPYRKKGRFCEACGNPLPKDRSKYCSDKCKPEEYTKLRLYCVTCKEPLPPFRSKYCSIKCEPRSSCIYCGKKITLGSVRCASCATNDPNYVKRHSERMLKFFRDHPEERCARTARAVELWNDPDYRMRMSKAQLGRKHTEEAKRKMGVTRHLAWERGIYDNPETRAKMSNGVKAIQSPTSIEIVISETLNNLGIEHQPQFRPEGTARIYDEYIPSIEFLLEVHGSYWHSTPKQQERDLEKARWAHQNGYKFIAIWDFHLKEYGAEFLVKNWILPLNPVRNHDVLRTQVLF